MKKNNMIRVQGAREHNLKNISVSLPKDSLTVITGPSGSGKSSLAFDVLHAEGQRRYLESLSSYARQFLGMPQKPDCDSIEGLCPAIAIDQKTVGSNPRSTVGTITEVSDYLRILFARIGILSCPNCGQKVQPTSPQEIIRQILEQHHGKIIGIYAPLVERRKGTFVKELADWIEKGAVTFVIDGQTHRLRTTHNIIQLNLKKTVPHTISAHIDTIEVLPSNPDERARLGEAIEKSCQLSGGSCRIRIGDEEQLFSTAQGCTTCGISFPDLEPRHFSFNSPLGACPACHGLGVTLPHEAFFGAVSMTCSTCSGRRLNDLALSVTIGDKNIFELGEYAISELQKFFQALHLTQIERHIAERLIAEITHRLSFLVDVGLGYLSINRDARSLSGGEGQRIRLARQLGSALSGILYLLDEPSIGLHQRDNDRLIATLKKLRDQGNTVIVVEHDFDTMKNADFIIDMGPAAGIHGGSIVATGTPEEIKQNPHSLTGQYLAEIRSIPLPPRRRTPQGFLQVTHAQANNLHDVTVSIPLGLLCTISGVSGSGKSSLVMDEIVPELSMQLKTQSWKPHNAEITGAENLFSMVIIDQSPIGRTPRSNPATYVGFFDEIRNLFAQLPESVARGYRSGRFSFNVKEGRCQECNGEGTKTIAMHFLPDVTVECRSCQGKRFNRQTLEITYRGKNIADILDMTIFEAQEFFKHHRTINKRLQLLCDVGLDYLKLGQPATTLSGGEAQRIKLVNELAKRGNKTLYVLDEPTTGLHACDIEKLLQVFDRLIEKGNSLLVIEHNLDVLKYSDYIIDMGPEGGDQGGFIIATGTPEHVAQSGVSYTGTYLKPLIKKEK